MRLKAFPRIRFLIRSFSATCFTSYDIKKKKNGKTYFQERFKELKDQSKQASTSTLCKLHRIQKRWILPVTRIINYKKDERNLYLTFEAIIYNSEEQVSDEVNTQ